MRHVFCLAVLSVCGCCAPPCNTMGWRFEVGKAPAVYTPALVSASSPVYGMAGLGSVPTLPTALAVQPRMLAQAPCVPGPSAEPIGPPRALAAAADPCTLQRLCEALDRIEGKLGTRTPPTRLPRAPDGD